MKTKTAVFSLRGLLLLWAVAVVLTAGVAAAAPVQPGRLVEAGGVLAQATGTPGVQVEVVAAALNMRQGPGVNYPILAVARSGDTFPVLGTNADRSWFQVSRPDGTSAWISGGAAYSRVLGSLDSVAVVQPLAAAGATGTGGASVAPAGGKLVFMTASGGDIYRINADGSGLQLLTRDGLDPALSPDGQQVAFTRWGPGEGVYLINADGSNERQVHAAKQPKSPTWSPDGARLVFNMQRGGRPEQTRECRLSSDKDDPNLPEDAFDIDRKEIVEDRQYEYCYSLPAKPAWQLRQLDLVTGQFSDLASDYGSFGPAWDPGNPWRVVYSGDLDLVQLDLDQNRTSQLAPGNQNRTPAFSADGARLAVTNRGASGRWSIQVIDLDGGAAAILATEGNNVSPTWSPDGGQIAFLSDRGGQWAMWVMNADGSSQLPMFAPGALQGLNFVFNGVDERMISWGK